MEWLQSIISELVLPEENKKMTSGRNEKGQFVEGHISWRKGLKLSQELKEKAISNLGRYARKGSIPWSKGKKGAWENPFKGKNLPWMIGKENPAKRLEVRKKLSQYKGNDRWNWKGGVVDLSKKMRKSLEWKLWRESVFARDNWICQLCNYNKKKLHPHHKYSFKSFPERRFEINNGLTLCEDCHRLLHSLKVNDILYGNIFTHQIYVQKN